MSGAAALPSEPHWALCALKGKCPRCGKGALFNGYLTPASSCAACGLDFSNMQAGDGPVAFVVLIVGFVVLGAGLAVELAYQPPYWVHAVLWLPSIVILSLALMRPIKAALMVLQYKHKAGEGRLAP